MAKTNLEFDINSRDAQNPQEVQARIEEAIEKAKRLLFNALDPEAPVERGAGGYDRGGCGHDRS